MGINEKKRKKLTKKDQEGFAKKNKKLLKSSKVRKYMNMLNKVMNAKFEKKFWREYHMAAMMGSPCVVFIPDKGKAKIKTDIFTNASIKEKVNNPFAQTKKRDACNLP